MLKMLNEIGSIDRIPEYIRKAKNKEIRLMGFGHRVYKNYDPRARVMRDMCHRVNLSISIIMSHIGLKRICTNIAPVYLTYIPL